MSGEVEFNSLNTKDDVKIKLEQPNGPRKPSDKEIAQYNKLRVALVIFFGLVIIAMVAAAVIIIIVSPKCIKAKGELNKSWLKEGAVYQVYARSFKDSSGDGNGDLKGIAKKLDHFKDLGVKVVRLDSIYASNGDGVSNYTQVNPTYGTMKDFEELLKAAHENGIKILLDFIPNHTSDKHPWFIESKKSTTNPKRSWYVWKDGKGGGAPNNWASVLGGSAWEKDATTGQFYLHQFSEKQPDLNLTNPEVKSALRNVLKFWLDKGVDGFNARDVQFMLEDSMFRDEQVKTGYNISDPKYDMLQHERTNDLSENVAVVEGWKKFMDDEYTDTYRALIVDVQGGPATTNKYYNCSDFPSNLQLISNVGKVTTAVDVNKTVVGYLGSLRKEATPNWVTGASDKPRVAVRLGENLVDAINVLLLTLPGVATTYYGEEIGMSGDPPTSPMQWSNDLLAGFSNKTSWSPIASDYKTTNVDTEREADGVSTYKLYKKLVELRSESAMKSFALKVVHADDKVFAYTRGDKDKYLAVINFHGSEWNGDLEKLSGRGKVVLDTKDENNTQKLDVNKIKLVGGQALVLKLSMEY